MEITVSQGKSRIMLEKSIIAKRKIESDGVLGAISTGFEEFYRYALPKFNMVDTQDIGIIQASDLHSQRYDSKMWTIPDTITSKSSADICRSVPRRMILPKGASFKDVDKHLIPEPKVFELSDTYLTSPDSIAISNNHKIIKPVIAPSFASDYRTNISLSNMAVRNPSIFRSLKQNQLDKQVSETIDVACPLVTLWPNYYHWVAECLPKLYALKYYQKQTGRKPTLDLPKTPSSWMIESLDLAGYSPKEWIICNDQVLKINKLVFPTYPDPAPEQCFWLRKQMCDGVSNINNSNRIYISRENATRRRVVNRSKVLELLTRFGFESYKLETLSVRDQVELFCNADVVIGPHGAGFVNMIFSNDPNIIELFGRKRKTTFYRLAKMLDVTYDWLYCQAEKCDIKVDVDRLEKKIKKYV